MQHIYQINNPKHPTFVLLHGTGGDEKDLVPLATIIDDQASYLGLLGEVRENGMPRFFKRLALNVFDEDDITHQTEVVHEFLNHFMEKHNLEVKDVVLLGYSNGANMAQSLLLHYPKSYENVMMLHPVNIKKEKAFTPNKNTKVFIGAGKYDPICPIAESELLLKRMQNAKLDVVLSLEDTTHQISYQEIEHAKAWYEANILQKR